MLVPKRNSYDLLDDIFDDEFFNIKSTKNELMKTDIKEHKDNYELITDLPGFEKENIKVSLENGYLTIHAKNNVEHENNENHGKIVRKERYFGECQRSFYVGDNLKDEDIKANFTNGVLHVNIPKVEEKKAEEKKYIEIK
jgi:HSP20 family molecular chaperone IbpA